MNVFIIIPGHNEQEYVSTVLSKVKAIHSQVIFVDDGSTDNTAVLAKAHTKHVLSHDTNLGKGAALKTGCEYAFSTLNADADEFLSTDLLRALPALIQDHESAYTAIWPYWDGTRYTTRHWPRKLFLYRIEDIDFLGAPHEAVRVNGSIMHLPHLVEHRPGYDNLSLHTFWSKWRKWAKIHASYYLKSHDDIKLFPKSGKRLYPHYHRWMIYAPVSAVPLGVYHTLACLLSGGITQGFIGVKSCFFMGLYYCVVALYVAWGKYGKNS